MSAPHQPDPYFREKMVGAAALIALVVFLVPLVLERPVHQSSPLPALPDDVMEVPVLPQAVPDIVPAEPPVTEQETAWVLQVGSFRSSSAAEQLATRLRDSGYSAFVRVPPQPGDNMAMHTVLIGPSLSIEKMRTLQQSLQQDKAIKGILKKYP